MGRARLIITGELLRELIPFPATTEIVCSIPSEAGNVEVIVDDPGIPETTNTDPDDLPLVTPTFRKNVPVEFVDWGVYK
jgi:hypothetical protein